MNRTGEGRKFCMGQLKDGFKEAVGRVKIHDHLCLIYETRAGQLPQIIHFVRAGPDRRENEGI